MEHSTSLEYLRAINLRYGRTFQDCQTIKKLPEFLQTDMHRFLLAAGPPETAGFYALIDKAESVAFPEQPLESVGSGSAKKKDDIFLKRAEVELLLYESGQAINPLTQIAFICININCLKATNLRQHRSSPP